MNNQTSYSTKLFEDAHGSAKTRYSEYFKEARTRLFFAYVFKAIAVLGGIILTTGLNKGTAQIVGIAISVVLAIDLIFSNHKRLLIISTASKGLGLFLEDIQFKYDNALQEVFKLRDIGKETEAKTKHDQINNDFATKCHEKSQEVRKAVDEADLKFLESLAVGKKKND